MTPHAEFLPRYLQLRKITSPLNDTLMETLSKDTLEEGARALGLIQEGSLAFGSEHEMAVLVDYCIYDIRKNGINAVERYHEASPPPTGSDEWKLLQACRQARYSLFAIESIEKGIGVWARDLLTSESLFVMDVGMSRTNEVGMVLALRVITVEGLSLTTGAGLPLAVFSAEMQTVLLVGVRKTFPGYDLANMSPEEMSAVATVLIRTALKAGAGERIITKSPEAMLKGRAPERLPPRSQPFRRLEAHPVAPRVGRNDPCPCESGKKFKRCCGGNA